LQFMISLLKQKQVSATISKELFLLIQLILYLNMVQIASSNTNPGIWE